MTILEALQAINSYPITKTHIEVICLDRDLVSTDEYTKIIGVSQGYELATADIWFYLAFHPSLVEQEVGINNGQAIKKQMLAIANKIYQKYDDDKFTGNTYGMIGENWNA